MADYHTFVERAYPDPNVRSTVLLQLAESILAADARSSTCWSVSFHGDHLSLNVGRLVALVLRANQLELTIDREATDADGWRRLSDELGIAFNWNGKPFRVLPSAYGVILPADRVDELLPIVQPLHLSLVHRAAETVQKRSPYYRAHDPAALEYLRQEVAEDLPNPDYGIIAEDDRSGPRYWKVSAGAGGTRWDEFRDQGWVAVDWSTPDLRSLDAASPQELLAQLNARAPGFPFSQHAARQLWAFLHDLAPGDLVCAYGSSQVLGWGEITGEYDFAEEAPDFRHRRDVAWLDADPVPTSSLPPALAEKLTQNTTILELTQAEFAAITDQETATATGTWWVNQGATYQQESQGGYLWAPKKGKGGYAFGHWTNMAKLQVGDLVVHYANSAIRAVGLVTEPAVDAPRPAELPTHAWDETGYMARVNYFPLESLIALKEIPADWRYAGDGPFTQDGGVKQGYLFPITNEFFDQLRDRFADRLPDISRRVTPVQSVWLFQARPDIWDLSANLKERRVGDTEEWRVTDYRNAMESGQPVVLWQAGNHAGVYAIGALTSSPFVREAPNQWAVPFRYTRILEQPILRADLLSHPILKDLSVIRQAAGTNFKVTREQWAALQTLIAEHPPGPTPPSLEEIATVTHLEPAELKELEELLLDKRQLVLEGPPGAGKTFLAEHFARYFAGLPLQGAPDARVETVQFHQSYGYEDFVQGIRPVTNEHGQLQYHVLPGIFMRVCELAARNPNQRFVLIIDEINRGNLSRIFGELLLLLEYRDKRVRLPYGAVDGKVEEAYLTIPKNLYLIGTMNSTDRSLALIDYALRRRFYFYRLLPVVDGRAPVLERWLARQGLPEADQVRVLRLFIRLNHAVEQHLSAEFQIGHSYFMREDIGSAAGLERIWKRAIMPLLEEYFQGARDRDTLLAELTPQQLLALPGQDEVLAAPTADER